MNRTKHTKSRLMRSKLMHKT